MSIEAVVWALKQAPTDDPTQTLVLVGMANHAHDDGTACWASVETLAGYARCSTRTVHRHLRTLEADGLIRRGDQRLVDHVRADHRPVVWNLQMTLQRGDNLTPREVDGVTPMVERGDTGDADEVTLVSHKPSFEVVLEPSMFELISEPPKSPSVEDDFDTWYTSFPRVEYRKRAFEKYKAARKKATAQELLDGAARYATQMRAEGREVKFMMLPATWLHQEGWKETYPTHTAASSEAGLWDAGRLYG